MRPNLAQDAPPTEISVGGFLYPVHFDFRVWIEISELLPDLLPDAQTPEDHAHNLEILQRTQELAFGGILRDEEPGDVLNAMVDFLRGYPTAPVAAGENSGPEVYSLDFDLNEIILAIRNQGGPDLSYRRAEPYHWWEFLLELKTLESRHAISRLMEIRGYQGKDKEMNRLKSRYALPKKQTAAEKQLLNAINNEFYNA